jgi:hypothetical protein
VRPLRSAGSSSSAACRRPAWADTVGAVVAAELRLDQRPGEGEGPALPLGVDVVHLSRLAVPNDAGVVEGEAVEQRSTIVELTSHPSPGYTASPIG